jgi:tetratricopeptide (TPR) repeat protein
MKSEHRHELKTNELAEWLGNLPQWTKENLTTILVILAVVVVGVTFLIWRSYNKNILLVRENLEFSNLLNQLSAIESQIPGAQAEGRDLSFQLIPAADSLGSFAQNTSNSRMAALALIKQAEALRTELHYRPGLISGQDLTDRVNQAKAAYTEAIQKSSDSATLRASAEFGLGLCEEELGNFEEAKKIYEGIAAKDEFEGTVAKAAARHRLETMADYRQKVVFKPAPTPAPESAASEPTIQMKPVDANLPTVSQPEIQSKPVVTTVPVDPNQESQAQEIFPDVNSKVPEPNVSGK